MHYAAKGADMDLAPPLPAPDQSAGAAAELPAGHPAAGMLTFSADEPLPAPRQPMEGIGAVTTGPQEGPELGAGQMASCPAVRLQEPMPSALHAEHGPSTAPRLSDPDTDPVPQSVGAGASLEELAPHVSVSRLPAAIHTQCECCHQHDAGLVNGEQHSPRSTISGLVDSNTVLARGLAFNDVNGRTARLPLNRTNCRDPSIRYH